ncbi:MAG TPA: dTDP-4-dehydrorhamnose 3,5-epimerase [Cytophaga sp.]|jgi:dTDP-4-dehydrorhamnose 3,5-epimerase|nr:dTDP-4-dehydrorhamnose 3,5-epimerase [Cytophaga sp.]
MTFKELELKDLILITPNVFGDDRGFFMETYNKDTFSKAGLSMEFVQDNHSKSAAGVVRGLHFQNAPYAQGKLVRATKGSIWDVVVDLRKKSPTYKQVTKVLLDDKSKCMLYVPVGFAHGFASIEDCEVQYKCTNLYHKSSELGIKWDDRDLAIDWGVENPLVSTKDQELPYLRDIESILNF